MSKQRHQGSQEELPLFDFPLEGAGLDSADPPADELAARRAAKRRDAAPNLHLVPKPQAPAPTAPAVVPGTDGEPDGKPAGAVTRLLSGLADLGAHALVLALSFAGVLWLGVIPTAASAPPFAILALVFSFLYCVVPLAFWGRTPGMTLAGEIARSLDDQPLSLGQTILRWLGALVTLALAGLPTLLALGGGRSLADLVSGSKTELV